jgi:hypothetical protein
MPSATATKPAKSTRKRAAAKSTTTTTKPQPPAKVATYIATWKTPEESRYAGKQWRHAAGHRATEPSLRGVSKEQATSIRQRIAELTG